MPDIIASDYQVLRDGELRLEDGQTRQFPFVIQNAFHYSTALRNHAVLTLNIRPVDTGRLTVRAVGVGSGTIMNRATFSRSHTRMYQEAFNLDGIVAQANQSIGEPIGTLLIEFRAEEGPLTLSDIVIHYKINVTQT